jgi:hypothetical protein
LDGLFSPEKGRPRKSHKFHSTCSIRSCYDRSGGTARRHAGREGRSPGLVAVTPVDPEAFKRADRDGDGKRSHYKFLYNVHRDFDAADQNQDGAIDLQELRVLMGR